MIGTDLNLDLPSLSDTTAVIVGKIVTALQAIEDSIADKATPAALNINSALSFGGNAATNVGSVQFAAGNGPVTPGSLYYANGEFYAVDATGTIQLTSLGGINAAGIGGIGGDYGGSNPAEVAYDDASGEYRFTEAPGVPADIVVDDVVLMEPPGSGTNFVRLTAPALAGDYTITVPDALPASLGVVKMSATGQLTLMLDAGEQLHIPCSAAKVFVATDGGDNATFINSANNAVYFPVGLPVGAVITGFSVYVLFAGATTSKLYVDLHTILVDTGVGQTVTGASVGLVSKDPGVIGSPKYTTLDSTGLSTTIAANTTYTLRVGNQAGIGGNTPTGDVVYHAVVTYTHPNR